MGDFFIPDNNCSVNFDRGLSPVVLLAEMSVNKIVTQKRAILIRAGDNVATALVDIESGDQIRIEQTIGEELKIDAVDLIPFGHKIAIQDINRNDPIIKYGASIGLATHPIKTGEHVHVHNLVSDRAVDHG